MTLMPIWIKERREDGILALLGSQPPADAQPVFIPHSRIKRIIEAGQGFAMVVLEDEK